MALERAMCAPGPEDEGSDDDKGGGVATPVGVDSAVGAKAPDAGATEECGDEGGNASEHVDDAAAGKVDHANAEEGLRFQNREPAGRGPEPACHKAALDEEGVYCPG